MASFILVTFWKLVNASGGVHLAGAPPGKKDEGFDTPLSDSDGDCAVELEAEEFGVWDCADVLDLVDWLDFA